MFVEVGFFFFFFEDHSAPIGCLEPNQEIWNNK